MFIAGKNDSPFCMTLCMFLCCQKTCWNRKMLGIEKKRKKKRGDVSDSLVLNT